MFTTSSQLNITLIFGATDMRKAIDGLFNIVPYDLENEPCSEQLFVFCGRARNKIKILQWSNNGFWLHYKQLKKATSNGKVLIMRCRFKSHLDNSIGCWPVCTFTLRMTSPFNPIKTMTNKLFDWYNPPHENTKKRPTQWR